MEEVSPEESYNKCGICKRFEGAPLKAPKPPPLPECRVTESPAFSYTGVDFAGPLIIRSAQSSKSNKAWIALFTCYVTRAVHLDTVQDQSTLTFIRCLKRFIARRGLPRCFISDNGKTFQAASKYLDKVFKDEAAKDHLRGLRISWQFNVPLAPWWGGAFERMVRSTKRCLRKLIGRAHFSLDELTTALAEIEAVFNSRPLSYVSGDDMEEPITPSHLIVGHRILNLPDDLSFVCDLDDDEFTLNAIQVTHRVKHLNNVLNHFWKRWRKEYLSGLREAHAYVARKHSDHGNPHVTVGDIVIVSDDSLPRGQWKLGIVQELLKGKDGMVRAATVKIASSDQQYSTLKRPIQLLYPLEIRCESSITQPVTTSAPEPAEDATEQVRPKRTAAKKAIEAIRNWVTELDEDD